jgi:hypothetical protein
MVRDGARFAVFLLLEAVSVAWGAYAPSLPWPQDEEPPRVRLTADIALIAGAAGSRQCHFTRCDTFFSVPFRFDTTLTVPYVSTRYLKACVGVEMRNGPGLSVGTTLLEYDMLASRRSLLPINLRASWDLSYDSRWNHSSAFVFVALHHTSHYYGKAVAITPPALRTEFGVGYACTYFALTPWAEFRVQLPDSPWFSPAMGLAVGLDLGGTYGFGRSLADEN